MYTFSSIEKEEYSKMYDFLKSKKINVKSTGKMDASKISLGEDVDHNLEKVRRTYLPNFLSTESWHKFLDMFKGERQPICRLFIYYGLDFINQHITLKYRVFISITGMDKIATTRWQSIFTSIYFNVLVVNFVINFVARSKQTPRATTATAVCPAMTRTSTLTSWRPGPPRRSTTAIPVTQVLALQIYSQFSYLEIT